MTITWERFDLKERLAQLRAARGGAELEVEGGAALLNTGSAAVAAQLRAARAGAELEVEGGAARAGAELEVEGGAARAGAELEVEGGAALLNTGSAAVTARSERSGSPASALLGGDDPSRATDTVAVAARSERAGSTAAGYPSEAVAATCSIRPGSHAPGHPASVAVDAQGGRADSTAVGYPVPVADDAQVGRSRREAAGHPIDAAVEDQRRGTVSTSSTPTNAAELLAQARSQRRTVRFAIDLPPTSGNDKENSTVNSQDDEYNQVDNSAAAAQDEITWNLPDGMSSEVSSPAEPTSPLSAYPALQLEPVLRDNSVTWSTNPLYDQLQYTIPIWRLGQYVPESTGYKTNARVHPLYEFPVAHLQDASRRAQRFLSRRLGTFAMVNPNRFFIELFFINRFIVKKKIPTGPLPDLWTLSVAWDGFVASILSRNGAGDENDWFVGFNARFVEFRSKNFLGVKWRLHEMTAEQDLGCPVPKKQCPFCYENGRSMDKDTEQSPRFTDEHHDVFQQYKALEESHHKNKRQRK
ncbi:hypothetical protein PR003_g28754 [Phytophthora rubi]|uniref:Uncharacterized protein n=1 Tax=Phytophthora rubi TaxID=129364 RepID=A0A6A4BWE2_9STRA|nr:hypothetical protein PR003_g28754 [Phytophthora rubi]